MTGMEISWLPTVSYTHLDVYKRQPLKPISHICDFSRGVLNTRSETTNMAYWLQWILCYGSKMNETVGGDRLAARASVFPIFI